MQVSHYSNSAGELRLSCERSEGLDAVLRSIGGGFDGAAREWVFPKRVAVRAEEEIARHFGLSDESVEVHVAAHSLSGGDGAFRGWRDGTQVTLGGYVLAARRYRDGRPEIKEPLVGGSIPASGGSTKNPRVEPTQDAVFSLEVRVDFADANGLRTVEVPPGEGQEDPEPEDPVDFRAGNYRLSVEIPEGSAEGTAMTVRQLVDAWDNQELLRRLRPAIG